MLRLAPSGEFWHSRQNSANQVIIAYEPSFDPRQGDKVKKSLIEPNLMIFLHFHGYRLIPRINSSRFFLSLWLGLKTDSTLIK